MSLQQVLIIAGRGLTEMGQNPPLAHVFPFLVCQQCKYAKGSYTATEGQHTHEPLGCHCRQRAPPPPIYCIWAGEAFVINHT